MALPRSGEGSLRPFKRLMAKLFAGLLGSGGFTIAFFRLRLSGSGPAPAQLQPISGSSPAPARLRPGSGPSPAPARLRPGSSPSPAPSPAPAPAPARLRLGAGPVDRQNSTLVLQQAKSRLQPRRGLRDRGSTGATRKGLAGLV